MGPFQAAALTEVSVHTVRFLTFRTLVFPADRGYQVSVSRYLVSALPLTLAGLTSVAMLRNVLDRTSLTIAAALISMVVGFIWSRFIYSLPVKRG